MADSLLLAGIELLGGGIPSQHPQAAGAIFRLGRSYDLGNPQVTVDLLTTLLSGDGERPVSWHTSNRSITLPIVIQVPSTGNLQADRLTLSGARELLLKLISAEEFELRWSPDGAAGTLDLVWDAFRAKASVVIHDLILNRQRISELAVTFDALPYGRSHDLATVFFDNPLVGQIPSPQPVTIDDFSTVSTSTQAPWWSQSPVTALFTNSARWSHNITDSNSPLLYTHTLGSAANLTGMSKVTFWLGLGMDAGRYHYWKRGTVVSFAITLTDNTARTLTFGTTVASTASEDQEWPKWNLVSASIPLGKPFTYSNVTAYSIKAWNLIHTWSPTSGARELDATGYLSGLRAMPAASPKRPASTRGGEYLLLDIVGTAPAPLNIQCQLGYLEQAASTQTFNLPGSAGTVTNWTAPAENPNWLASDSSGFEQATIGAWVGADGLAANGTLTASTTQAHSGTYALRVTPITGGTTITTASCLAANVAAQGVPCAPGDRIAVRAWARAGTTSRNVTVGAEFFTSGGASLGIVALSPVADTSGSWTQITGRVTAPASAASARLTVAITTPAAGEFHYLDDCYLAYAVQATVICLGAGGGGGSVQPTSTAAGGAGSGEIAWETNLDLTPAGTHAYSVGAGGLFQRPPTGAATAGGDSYFTGTSVTVRGHGGGGGQNVNVNDYSNGSGGAGGSGSTNAHHFNGGSGATGNYPNYRGGGAGGPAGDGGAGSNGGTGAANIPGAGGSAGALGIGGGQGGSGEPGIPVDYGGPGAVGQGPGAGGGGAACLSHERAGGNGNNGLIRMIIKTYTTQGQFPALLLHKPSTRSGLLAKPVIDVGNSADIPDGREYSVDPVDGQNALYRGTYSVVLVAWSFASPSTARTITVSMRQYAAGVLAGTAQVSASIVPTAVVNGMIPLGELTLPAVDHAPDNTDAYYTTTVTSGQTGDRFMDVLLLDTQGATYWVNQGAGFVNYWVDAPDPTADLGRVLGSNAGRASATSVLGGTLATGGPLTLVPGDNLLVAYSPAGQPSVYGEYFPRWWHERLT